MKIPFTKMHGLGNDFIVIDCRARNIPNLPRVVRRLSDRRFGVGFDQALILKKSRKADFRMDIYNADGGRVEMCGNGIRCFAMYVWSRRLSRKARLDVETMAGIIRPERAGGAKGGKGANLVRVDMGAPVLEGSLIPTAARGRVIDHPLKAGGRTFKITCVSMGNPHAVIFVEDVDAFPVEEYGPIIEKDGFFPKRTNVEFVEVRGPRRLRMRVWERGAGETLACGTGASASAVAARVKGLTAARVTDVELKGGRLTIEWDGAGPVYMTGPAEEVFTGTATI